MSVLLCLKKGADIDAFLAEAQAAGIALTPLPGLPRHFSAPQFSPATFPLAGHPAIAAIDEGDTPARGEEAAPQMITIDRQMAGGSWAIARHIRRDAPWLVAPRLRHPIGTMFRCNRTGAGVDAYVVDSGLRYDHAVFGGRASFVGGTYGAGGVDDHGHGTSVAAVLAGDVVGLARGAGLRIVKGLDASNSGTFTAIASAIGMARADFEARAALGRPSVLNLSLSANGATIDAAVADCIDAGLIVVASAGNDITGPIGFPAASADVICVGGLRANDTPYYIGNTGTSAGPRVDILAGAERIWTASFTAPDAFRLGFGTSYAAPLVAGALACMLQGRPRPASRTHVQAVRDALLAAATTGRFQPQPQFPTGDLPDRILWLDPDATDVPIPGLG
jgi:subtilisin family serine protease